MEKDDLIVWECKVCLYRFDEKNGIEEEGIAPGTKWEDLPQTWICPNCGVHKSKFRRVQRD